MSVIPNIPQPKYLNLEYLFDQFFKLLKKLAELFLELFKILGAFWMISIIVSILFAVGIGVVVYKIIGLRWKRRLADCMNFLTEEGEPKERSFKWDEIKKMTDSPNPSDWKVAVIEADSVVDKIFEKIGFKGDGLGEKLKSVEPSDFDSLQNIWDAHQVRKKITPAADGFELSQKEAKTALDKYEKALKELRYI